MLSWAVALLLLIAVASLCLLLVSFFWFRRFRRHLRYVLGESVAQNVMAARLSHDKMVQLQQQMQLHEQQIHALAQANLRLTQALSGRTTEDRESEAAIMPQRTTTRILH